MPCADQWKARTVYIAPRAHPSLSNSSSRAVIQRSMPLASRRQADSAVMLDYILLPASILWSSCLGILGRG